MCKLSLIFFTNPFPDELLFSVCARFHKRSGNIHEKATLQDLFSNRSITASVFLPSAISALIANMPPFSKYSEEQFIFENTLYPFISAFLPERQANKVYQSMLGNDGKDIYVRAGIIASGVPQNKFIRFCPLCFQDEEERYGEPYFHRTHQLSGIHCCLEHFTPLFNSTILTSGGSKHRFEFASKENCIVSDDADTLGHVSDSLREKYVYHVRQMAPYLKELLNRKFDHKELNWFGKKYKQALVAKGLAYYSGRVKQEDWRAYFLSRYNHSILDLFFSSIGNDGDWLSMIVQKHRKSFHPIRHLLVMTALDISLGDLFKEEFALPFGSPSWPCLNPVCGFYEQAVIKTMELTLCDKTKNPIGTFICPHCKFTYTRRGPDKAEQDRFRKTRVKSYGKVWGEKLKEQAKLDISLRELSRRMGADPNTVKRFLNQTNNNTVEMENLESPSSLSTDQRKWLDLMKENPDKTTKQLRISNKALYMRLYRANNEWLKINSPKPIKRSSKERIDWSKRDDRILGKVMEAVKFLLKPDQKPMRVTISKIGTIIGDKALLEKKISKLPKTKQYLDCQLETVEEFRQRRLTYVINEMEKNGDELITWVILRKAGLPVNDYWTDQVDNVLNNICKDIKNKKKNGTNVHL